MARNAHPSRLDIRLLGPPEVLVDGRPLVVDTRKAVAILALLAAEGRPFARDELAALLWPESDDASARGALRRTLSTLRAAVGDGPLVVERARVALARHGVRSDVADLERLAGSVDASALQAAADLARGPFLAGFNLRDSPEFDDWRATRAVAIERTVLGVLDRLSVSLEAGGKFLLATKVTARRLDLDPLDEGGHLRLMELLATSGDRMAALRQYRACVAILDRELGVAPLAATTARYEAIRGQDDAVAKAPADVLPPSSVGTSASAATLPMVGRDRELEAIARARISAAGGSGRIVGIIGEPGIGKTLLAHVAAARIRADDGVVLDATAHPAERGIPYGPIVEWLRAALALPDAPARLRRLDPATRGELSRLLPAVEPHRAFEPTADGPGAHARLVAAIADGLTSLVSGPVAGALVLDDVQWLDGASREALAFLGRRLDGRPIVVLLAWRTEDLGEDALDDVGRLMALPAAVTLPLARLDRSSVAALAAAAGGDGPTDPDVVDRLVAASEGLPLYVVAALAAGPAGASALPLGVGAAMRERLRSVGEATGQVLAAASVIGRSFDLATVRHASGRSEDETISALDEAIQRGLIREAPGGFDFIHGALRDQAYQATSLARRRLLHRRVAEALRLDLAGTGPNDLALLVLTATHERAAGNDKASAEAFFGAGRRAEEVFANREAIDHFTSALAMGHPEAFRLHAAVGRLRTRLGDYAGAIAALESAAAVAPEEDLPELECALGRAHLRRGDLGAADHHLDAAIAGSSDAVLLARAWADRSLIRRRAGDLAAATDAATRARSIADQGDDRVAAGVAARMLGLIALDRGASQIAITHLTDALDAAAGDPDPTAGIAALAGLAMAAAATGALAEAMRHGEEAVVACRRIGDRHLEAAVENHLADILHLAGREDEALDHLRCAVAAFAEVGGDPADPDPGIWMLSAS